MQYNLKVFTAEPNTSLPYWAKEEVTSVSGTTVILSEIEKYQDGTIKNNQHILDLSNPYDPNNPDPLVFPANMTIGQVFGPPAASYTPLYKSSGQYCGAQRTVLSYSANSNAGSVRSLSIIKLAS